MTSFSARHLFLGIEGGGTHTVAILADEKGRLVSRSEAGPANLRLLSDSDLVRLFRSIAARFPRPDAIGIGMAGVRSEGDRRRIRSASQKIWPSIPCHVSDDLETALAAEPKQDETNRVLVLSGTGSCCYGRTPRGKTVKVGGWGHILGDQGSGYQIGLESLKIMLATYDDNSSWHALGSRILRRLQINEPNDLIAWAQSASKPEVAELAIDVFAAWKAGDKIAARVVAGALESLTQDAIACARRLGTRGTATQFVLAGGTLIKQPEFSRRLASRLKKLWPGATVAPLKRESAWGAVALAQKYWRGPSQQRAQIAPPELPPVQSELSPTEQRNPRSSNLDKLPVRKAIDLMLSEDAKIPAAIRAERKKLERAVLLISQALKRGGRLFYVGAGTSGRLGVLDASECPPTFRTPPEMVQGIIAGGATALSRSVEGAEDDSDAGARAIEFRHVNRRDVVVGIAASGRTPFVWGALCEASRRGAKTILLTFNPRLKHHELQRLTMVIAPNVGPEILTGSTRLKAGTATKLILNIFTTLAMVRLGKVRSNLMLDLNPSNAKLRDRAIRIVRELCDADEPSARRALEKSGWVVKKACTLLDRSRLAKRRRVRG